MGEVVQTEAERTVAELGLLFRADVRGAGEILLAASRVYLEVVTARELRAKVYDGRGYVTRIALDRDLALSCTCPGFGPHRLCGHVWATLLKAATRGAPPWRALVVGRPPPRRSPSAQDWKRLLRAVGGQERRSAWQAEHQLVYILDISQAQTSGAVTLEIGRRWRKLNGEWGRISYDITYATDIGDLAGEDDRLIAAHLAGAEVGRYGGSRPITPADVRGDVGQIVLPLVARTGRCFVRDSSESGQAEPLRWDDGGPWRARLKVEAPGAGSALAVSGELVRGSERMSLEEPALLMACGLVLARGTLAPLTFDGGFRWIQFLRRRGKLAVPQEERAAFLAELYARPDPPEVEWPEGLGPTESVVAPCPRVRVIKPSPDERGLPCRLTFVYGDVEVESRDPRRRPFSAETGVLVTRDFAAEERAVGTLLALKFRRRVWGADIDNFAYGIASRNLPSAVRELLAAGWKVEAEGFAYKSPGACSMSVRSGIDWFDLEGGVQYGEEWVPFPRLLEALRRGQNYVDLGDGTRGMLPEEWLRKALPVLRAGKPGAEALRFRPTQALLLDALLAAEERPTCDEAYARLRDRLAGFEGVRALDPPPGFSGTLREYQRLGLGWMGFLREFGFGGCLADDMGLGKTVQVLALLESRRAAAAGPSLVVVPRSLVFHWKAEAARFAPQLRVVDHTGIGRATAADALRSCDVLVTTYGTLRRDAAILKDVEFDCVILDEATAIKNPQSVTAKAALLLRGRQRLALTGTPVENHLGELWSLCEFLNPGMLGRASAFEEGLAAGDEGRATLARALRPFILRRTKAQVAPELPERLEETILCDLSLAERKRYNELRAHYRAALLGGDDGMWERSKIHVLEALLRLRQAALHPGLFDRRRLGEPSAKVELLLERLREVIDEGHKALVFSQFTSFLAIVRERLDATGVTYEYLDGHTRDRGERVQRFQSDPKCPLFLISLKAGGHGLNLTAAEYVFLLDPWWNPAVEAQAIDRTHRIGQERRVFAFRLIARDTVEEKVVELQGKKRRLADAIINEDNSLLRDLKREDLELLLS